MKSEKLSWVNPIVPNRADPWMMKHSDGFYYFIATVPTYDLIELRRSRTIEGIQTAEPVVIWRQHETGEMCHHIWAPELHFIKGRFYIYFAAATSQEPWRIRMYVLACKGDQPLEDPWEELGRIKTKWDTFSLDATVLHHKGKDYLIWAQSDPENNVNSNLYIDLLIEPSVVAGHQVLLTTPSHSWERIGFNVNEGPATLTAQGKVFVSYSASKTDHNYCLGLLWMDESADPLDPMSWHKSEQPVFCSSEKNRQYGPGHNAFVATEEADRFIMVYHARNYKEIEGDPLYDPNRHARAQMIHVIDGMIEFGEPVSDGYYEMQ